jgi:Stage II sporulation protein E (SpoIIE)
VTDRRPVPPTLDDEHVERILAPFRRPSAGLSVSLEDASGRTVVGAPGNAAAGGARLTRDLRADGIAIGRLIAEGPAVTDRSVAAALEAVAVGLETLAEAAPGLGPDEARDAKAAAPVADPRSGIAAELAMSRMQQRSIVSLLAPDVEGYDLASHYEPAREVGGDFFELFRVRRRGQPLGLVIADVAGKGIAAALLMAFARPIIHTALTVASGPADALERTNRILVQELRTALFITALVGRLDLRSGRVRIANAGHERPLLVPADGRPIVPVEGGGPLLGAFDPLGLEEVQVRLRPGDRLVLYTDGVTDSQAPNGERFGLERLLATLEAARAGTAHDLVAAVRDAEAAFRNGGMCADDVTIVAVGRQTT